MADVTLGDLQGYSVEKSDLADYAISPSTPKSHYEAQKAEKAAQVDNSMLGSFKALGEQVALATIGTRDKADWEHPLGYLSPWKNKEDAEKMLKSQGADVSNIENIQKAGKVAEGLGAFVATEGLASGALGELLPEAASLGGRLAVGTAKNVGSNLAGSLAAQGASEGKVTAGQTALDTAAGLVLPVAGKAALKTGKHLVDLGKGAVDQFFPQVAKFVEGTGKEIEAGSPEWDAARALNKMVEKKVPVLPGIESSTVTGGNTKVADMTGKFNRGQAERLAKRSNAAYDPETAEEDTRRAALQMQRVNEGTRGLLTDVNAINDANLNASNQLKDIYAQSTKDIEEGIQNKTTMGGSVAAEKQAVDDFHKQFQQFSKDLSDKVDETMGDTATAKYESQIDSLEDAYNALPQDARDFVDNNFNNIYSEGFDPRGDFRFKSNLQRYAHNVNPSWRKGNIKLDTGLPAGEKAPTGWLAAAKGILDKLTADRAATAYKEMQDVTHKNISSLAQSAMNVAKTQNKPLEEVVQEIAPELSNEEASNVAEAWERLNTTPKRKAEIAPELKAEEPEEVVEPETWEPLKPGAKRPEAKVEPEAPAERLKAEPKTVAQLKKELYQRNVAEAEARAEAKNKTVDEMLSERQTKAQQKSDLDWANHEDIIKEIDNGALGDVEPTATAEAVRQLTKGGTKPLRSLSSVRTKLWDMEQQAAKKAGKVAKTAETEAAKPTIEAQEQTLVDFLQNEAPQSGQEGADLVNRTIKAAKAAGAKRVSPAKMQSVMSRLGDMHVSNIAKSNEAEAASERSRLNNWFKQANAGDEAAKAEMERSVAERNKQNEGIKSRSDLAKFVNQVKQNLTNEVGKSPEADQFVEKFLRNNTDMFDKAPSPTAQGEILRRATAQGQSFAKAMKEAPTTVTKTLYPEIADSTANEMFKALPESDKEDVAKRLLDNMLNNRGDLRETGTAAKELADMTGNIKTRNYGEVLEQIARNKEDFPNNPELWMNQEMYPKIAANESGTVRGSEGNNLRNAVFGSTEKGRKVLSRTEQQSLMKDVERLRDHEEQLTPKEKQRIKAKIREARKLMGIIKGESGALSSAPKKAGVWKIRK